MSNITDLQKFNEAKWKQRLLKSRDESVQAILDFGKEVYEFKQECDAAQGGSMFTAHMMEWLGMSPATSSKWLVIGERYDELFGNAEKLPNSSDTILLIARMSDDQIADGISQGVITPETPRREITKWKKELEGKPVIKESTKPEGSFMWRTFVEVSGVAPKFNDRELRSGQNNDGVRDLIEQALGKKIPQYIIPNTQEANELLAAVRAVYEREYPGEQSAVEMPVVKEIPIEVSIDEFITGLANLIPSEVMESLKTPAGLPTFTYTALVRNRKNIHGMLDRFSKKYSQDFMRGMIDVLNHQNEIFEQVVKDQKPKYIKALEAKLKAELEAQKEKTKQLTADSIQLPEDRMTPKEVKQIKGVLHPDRLSSLSEEKMNAAFQIFKRVYK